MAPAEDIEARFGASIWGQWIERADAEAKDLAQGKGRRRRGAAQPPEPVVALLAIADLKDAVIEALALG